MITTLDIIGNLIASLRRDELTQRQLLSYCEDHAHILKSDIEQALLQHQAETTGELPAANLPRYAADKERILANDETFSRVADRVIDQAVRTYGHDIPDMALVPCIGLFANGDRDASQPLQRLTPCHKFYFTTSSNPDYPNIGYAIGYLYLKHLHRKYTLPQLRTFARTNDPSQAEFASFISTRTRPRPAAGSVRV